MSAQMPGVVDCSSATNATSAACQSQRVTNPNANPNTGLDLPPMQSSEPVDQNRMQTSGQVYVDRAGTDVKRTQQDNLYADRLPKDPPTDFQRLVQAATGELLPIFGRDLFQRAPTTFAPADQVPVTADYVVGPGDEILLRLWGPETFNSQLTVDTAGAIYIPKVGAVHVAGLRYDELQKKISTDVSRVYRNFDLSINLGHLRSVQIYVVGEARRPGAYTISGLSTVLNALFVSGGPNVQGSLRRIQVRRDGVTVSEFDLYDLVLRGDKSKDVRLQSGDTIFIPASGPQVALAGSVRHPAIFETRGDTTIPALLQIAGGFGSTAVTERVSLERIDADHSRKALTIAIAAEGQTTTLRDGDVIFVNHISPGYEQSVTIRGNLANAGRFAWHTGMRLSEIIPDRKSLLSNDYWRERNRFGIPTPLFERLPSEENLRTLQQGDAYRQGRDGSQAGYPQGYGQTTQGDPNDAQTQRNNSNALALQTSQLPSTTDASQAFLFSQGIQNNQNATAAAGAAAAVGSAQLQQQQTQGNSTVRVEDQQSRPLHRIEIPVPEIDWSYAVIERLDPNTLKSLLLPFNLGKLVQDHDATQDLELQPGDIVTILSQADIPVPLNEQTKFVRLEGEFASAGVYSARPGETLDDLVRRAGGLSPNAYLYGSSFLRQTARVFQQQRLDEYISTLAADMERATASRAASSASGVFDPNALAEQRNLIAQLRQLRATGRIVLEFKPASEGVATIPKIGLENLDVFRVPSRPATVSVVGAVYGQNVFLFDPKRKLEDYVSLAGKPNRIADRKHAFIIRADGSIYSRSASSGFISNRFDNASINPGDSIVIPEKLIKPSALRQFIDFSQILSSFGLAAAAINVVR